MATFKASNGIELHLDEEREAGVCEKYLHELRKQYDGMKDETAEKMVSAIDEYFASLNTKEQGNKFSHSLQNSLLLPSRAMWYYIA